MVFRAVFIALSQVGLFAELFSFEQYLFRSKRSAIRRVVFLRAVSISFKTLGYSPSCFERSLAASIALKNAARTLKSSN